MTPGIPQNMQRMESNLNSFVNLFSDADIKIIIINHFGTFEKAQFRRWNGLISKSLPN